MLTQQPKEIGRKSNKNNNDNDNNNNNNDNNDNNNDNCGVDETSWIGIFLNVMQIGPF